MWVRIEPSEAKIIERSIGKSRDVKAFLKRLKDAKVKSGDESTLGLIDKARELYANHSDDDIEIDDDAAISESDNGTWVMAWVYLRKDDNEEDDE